VEGPGAEPGGFLNYEKEEKTAGNSAYDLWRESGNSKLITFCLFWSRWTGTFFGNRHKPYPRTVDPSRLPPVATKRVQLAIR